MATSNDKNLMTNFNIQKVPTVLILYPDMSPNPNPNPDPNPNQVPVPLAAAPLAPAGATPAASPAAAPLATTLPPTLVGLLHIPATAGRRRCRRRLCAVRALALTLNPDSAS